jgi:peptidoglycan/xylan/chitin deacetylase (PgdA/CDA1 family)
MPIPILMYHQIDEPPPRGTSLRGLIVAPSSFAWQMRMLKWMGYRALSMTDLEPYLAGDKQGKVVGLTFDDGYQNNLHHALPVILKMGFTATCYGLSCMFGGSNAWDHGKVAEKPLMNAQEWQQWVAAGMDVGSHTRWHRDLSTLSSEDALSEITLSKSELTQQIGCEVRHFCYPYGRYSTEHVQMVKAAGYQTATTTRRGRVNVGDDPLELRRVMVARATHPLQFYMKIATAYEDRRA